jgi:hypothetical protein
LESMRREKPANQRVLEDLDRIPKRLQTAISGTLKIEGFSNYSAAK